MSLIATNQAIEPVTGTLTLSGIVQNVGTDYVWGPYANLAFYDSAGQVIESGDGATVATTDLLYLAPGELAGFSLRVFDPPAGYDHFGVVSIVAEDSNYAPNHNFTVTVTGTADDGIGGKLISGTITNRNTTTANGVEIPFIFFDASGKVVDTDLGGATSGSTTLGPGETTAFQVDYLGPPYATFTAVGEAGLDNTGPSGCIGCAPIARISGSTRIGTAVAASQAAFAAGGAKAVVLARDDQFPDALAGGPLAAHVGGPLLLTSPSGLDTATATEIQRVAPADTTIYILGGPAAISTSVDDALTALGYTVTRLYGDSRFATAVAVAKAMGSPTTVFEATGLNFPDALSGGPAAAELGAAILLTNGSSQAPETTAYLEGLASSTRYALGGPAASADPSATAIVGNDRFDTSTRIASRFFPAPTRLGLATAGNFPDALGAGPLLAGEKAPLVLVPAGGPLPASLYSYFTGSAAAGITAGTVFGGTIAVPESVVTLGQIDLAAAKGNSP